MAQKLGNYLQAPDLSFLRKNTCIERRKLVAECQGLDKIVVWERFLASWSHAMLSLQTDLWSVDEQIVLMSTRESHDT